MRSANSSRVCVTSARTANPPFSRTRMHRSTSAWSCSTIRTSRDRPLSFPVAVEALPILRTSAGPSSSWSLSHFPRRPGPSWGPSSAARWSVLPGLCGLACGELAKVTPVLDEALLFRKAKQPDAVRHSPVSHRLGVLPDHGAVGRNGFVHEVEPEADDRPRVHRLRQEEE